LGKESEFAYGGAQGPDHTSQSTAPHQQIVVLYIKITMKLLHIKNSTRRGKKKVAVFEKDGKTRTVHFGSDVSQTFVEGASKEKRDAYIARHSKNGEDWSKPATAGALSYHVLWGKSDSIETNIRSFKRRFSL